MTNLSGETTLIRFVFLNGAKSATLWRNYKQNPVTSDRMTLMVKTTASLEIVLKGEGITPEVIPVRTLADCLTSIQRIAQGDPFTENETEDIRLLGVRKGSAVYKFATNKRTISSFKRLGLAIHKDNQNFADAIASTSSFKLLRGNFNSVGSLECSCHSCAARIAECKSNGAYEFSASGILCNHCCP